MRGYYREWDHQMMWQPTVCQVREKIASKYDPVIVLGGQLSPPEIDALYGTRQDSACKMPPL